MDRFQFAVLLVRAWAYWLLNFINNRRRDMRSTFWESNKKKYVDHGILPSKNAHLYGNADKWMLMCIGGNKTTWPLPIFTQHYYCVHFRKRTYDHFCNVKVILSYASSLTFCSKINLNFLWSEILVLESHLATLFEIFIFCPKIHL